MDCLWTKLWTKITLFSRGGTLAEGSPYGWMYGLQSIVWTKTWTIMDLIMDFYGLNYGLHGTSVGTGGTIKEPILSKEFFLKN